MLAFPNNHYKTRFYVREPTLKLSVYVKVRLQGTKEDMEWLEEQLRNIPNVEITESSEIFRNKGTNKYYRKYIEVEKTTN